MLTLLLGRDWTANRKEILIRLAKDVQDEKPGRILMVPELISHDTERRLAAMAGDTSSRFAQVLSFTRLGRRICDLVGNGAEETLDNGGRVVAMAAAVGQLHSRLKAYAALETKPEFLTDMVDAVDEFKRCCIGPGDLKAASMQTEGSLAQKLEELSLILESYDSICQQGKRDPRSQMTWVLEQLEEMDFAENHVFYIDGFPDFTRQHLAILEHMILHSEQVTVSLNCDCPDSVDPAFETAGRTARELISLAKKHGVKLQIQQIEERDDGLRLVRRQLFRGNPAVLEDPDLLRVCRTGSIYQECQAAAEEISQRVRDGLRYRDFALVCPNVTVYGPVLRLIFGKYGIPLYLSGTEDILQSSVISTVLWALDAALSGFERQDVLRYSRSVLSPLEPEEADRLENYAMIWAISGSKWLKPWENHPMGLSAMIDQDSIQRLQELNDIRCRVIQPLERLRTGIEQATRLGDMVVAIYGFLEDLDFASRLDALAQSMDLAGDNRSAQILNQLWEILLGALEQMYDVLGAVSWQPDTFQRLLRLLLSQYDVGTIPPVLDSVMAGTVSTMRCQQQKMLIVLGAEEGNLPGYAGSGGLLTDLERVMLRSLGVPLTGGAMDGLQAEYAEIYGVFCGAENHISLYCSADQPSFIYHRLAAMAGKEWAFDPQNACSDPYAAAAMLAHYQDQSGAQTLGLENNYLDSLYRSGYSLGTVTPEHIRGIYGNKLILSASQVDRQAECRLSYFLKYGLRAQERKEATVDPAEFGTYVHAVLEETAKEVMSRGGFRQVDLETTLAIAEQHSAKYAQAHFSQLESQRMEYLFRRNTEELRMVVRELWRELSQAEYVPSYFELQFDRDGQMPAIEIPSETLQARLRGFVDRVDVWKNENSRFVRVVDYKTGKKDFDYCDVYNGVGLQMLLYLFALEDAGEELIGPGRISAGVQYFPARAPYVSVDGSMTPEEAEGQRKKMWKRSGLLLENEDSLDAMDPSEKLDTLCCTRKKDGSITGDVADRMQLRILKKYVMDLLSGMVDQIASGDVSPNPYTRGTSHDACSFCPYGQICRKETVAGRRNYKAMSAEEFWQALGEEDDRG